jgi:hypothetical protein
MRTREVGSSSCPCFVCVCLLVLQLCMRLDEHHHEYKLTCTNLIKGELSRRHDAVVNAIGRVAWMVGGQVKREVEGLLEHGCESGRA